MRVRFYLTISKGGSVKATKRPPGLDWDEVAMAMDLTLPDALFQKPALRAVVTVPDEAAAPAEIEADVQHQVEEAIRAATGLEVRVVLEDAGAGLPEQPERPYWMPPQCQDPNSCAKHGRCMYLGCPAHALGEDG